jgi:hypothetical protein
MLTRGSSLTLLAGAVALGCGHPSGGSDPTCQDQEPAFVLTVRTADGTLPAGAHLVVRYGGDQTEEYSVGVDGGSPGPMVFCEEAASASGAVASLRCQLYTGQAAEVTVDATGYPTASEVLALQRTDEDCVVTRSVEIILQSPDAGG